MDNCCLPVGVGALACAIAEQIQSNSELVLLATLLTQLGDTLSTIVATREVCREREERCRNIFEETAQSERGELNFP